MSQWQVVAESVVAGLFASIACGLGVLPLAFRGFHVERHIGIGYAFAGGLMFSASVYNLLLPALTEGNTEISNLSTVLKTLGGMALGCLFLWWVERYLTPERLQSRWFKPLGGRIETLVFLAMCFHSIPEGVAVGVGYGAEGREQYEGLGFSIALAIGIHNMPEGLAVALPLRAHGASIPKCFLLAFITSLPQPIAAVPSSWLVWFFEPLLVPSLGFAAGAMMYLVLVELIPDALERQSNQRIAWAFMAGFGLMALVQVVM